MSLYLGMTLWADGILIYQNQTIDVDQPNTNAPVDTIPLGRAGPAPGPDVTMISITNAVPKAGTEYDWAAAKEARTEVEIKVQGIAAPDKLVGKFIVESYKRSAASGAPTTESIEMSSVGSPAPRFK